jgi:cobalamin biosynthesis Mg chelatase CobN
MNLLFFYLIAAFARVSVCQNIVTIWVTTVTVPPSSPSAAAFMAPQAVNHEIEVSETQRTSSSTNSDATISTSATSSSHESGTVHESTSSQALPQVTASPDNEYYEPEVSTPSSSGIDTEGGASGSGAAAFSLSTGGLVAILIVVILVALFGSKSLRLPSLVLR